MQKRVLIEMRVPEAAPEHWLQEQLARLKELGLDLDAEYMVKVRKRNRSRHDSIVLRGTIEEGRELNLQDTPGVLKVWSDASIEPLEATKAIDLTF